MVMSYHNLHAQEVGEFLTRPGAVVIDVRDPASYARGHIEGAQPAEESVVSALLRKRRLNPPVLVYCYHGNSSRDLAALLAEFGFTQVYNLEGGWRAWETLQTCHDVALSEKVNVWAKDLGFDTANLASRIENGMTMLMTAARQGRQDIALELLQNGADPNLLNDDGNNALWFACFSGEGHLIRSLIEYGSDLDNQNVNGATCLIYAASAGKFDVVEILVGSGASLDPTTLDGFSALDSAATLPILKFLKPRYAAA